MSPVDEGRLPARLDQYTVVPDPTNPALCETCWGVGQVVRAGRPVGCRVCAGTGHASPSGGAR